MRHVKNLVVGAGVSGAVIAERIASQRNEEVLVIDQRGHIAGNCYDYRDHNGIMIHKYGSHIFHTNNHEVWEYVSQFSAFNTYMHKVVALIDGIETTIPFNLRSLFAVFPPLMAKKLEKKLLEKFQYNTKVPILEFKQQDDADLRFLADYIYEKVFLHYTTKQWGVAPDGVDGAVTARVPVHISCDPRYFQDTYQGIPTNGYTAMIQKMLEHPNVAVELNTSFASIKEKYSYDKLFYTGSIDEFFDYKYGMLPYRSVHFELEEHDREFYQSNAVVNYPCNYDFTRVHEYKYYLQDTSSKTVIAKEYSEEFEVGKNERYYPIPGNKNNALRDRYLRKIPNADSSVNFLGRLGEYKYYDMDKAVEKAFALFSKNYS